MKSIDSRIIKALIALAGLAFTVYLFVIGRWGWGIVMILVSALLVLFVLRSIRMILAFFQLRKQDTVKAKTWLNRINPDHLWKNQKGYYYFLLGTVDVQQRGTQVEKHFKEALRLGLRMDHDKAMTYLNLAVFAMNRRQKREAIYNLNECKKYDTKGMLKNEIKQVSKMVNSI